MIRGKYIKQKDIVIINDVPVKSEIEIDEKFSSPSNITLLNSFATGKVNPFSEIPKLNHQRISLNEIHFTYLDYSYYGEPDVRSNYDFNKEIKISKHLSEEEKNEFIKLSWCKDIYVSQRLWNQFQELVLELNKLQPKLIVVTGKWSLFFLSGITSYAETASTTKEPKPLGALVKLRSSLLKPNQNIGLNFDSILIPIWHTINAIYMPAKIYQLEADIARVCRVFAKIKEFGLEYFDKPSKNIILGTNVEIVEDFCKNLLSKLEKEVLIVSIDIETFFHSLIDCIGLSISKDEGICIPFCHKGNAHFWSIKDEIKISSLIREILLHKNTRHLGQNYSYDCQYFYKLWLIDIKPNEDTMILHHILYNFMPKNLAFLASLYCEFYSYWKDDSEAIEANPETRWIYNVKDICYTYEVFEILENVLKNQNKELQALYRFTIDDLSSESIKTMNRGIRINVDLKQELFNYFNTLMLSIGGDIKNGIRGEVQNILDMDFNLNSTPQKKKLFKEFLSISLEIKKRKGKESSETCDAAAMIGYIGKYPIYKPFLTLLLEHAALKIFVTNFLGMKLDDDGRARTQYKVAHTALGRLASTKNVWGNGGNFQNLPTKGKLELKYAIEAKHSSEDEELEYDEIIDLSPKGTINLPNIKKIFIPDENMEIMDADLSGADAFTYFLDSECKNGIDFLLHPKGKLAAWVASNHLQREITENDDEYRPYKASHHGWWYGMEVKKLAQTIGCSEEKAEELNKFYSFFYPERNLWHKRLVNEVKKHGYITNCFGRRMWFLDSNDPTFKNKIFAAKPQSVTSDVINRGWINVSRTFNDVEILMQVHDSLVMQYLISVAEERRGQIIEAMRIPLPYGHGLAIPVDFKVSRVSYGDCSKVKKP